VNVEFVTGHFMAYQNIKAISDNENAILSSVDAVQRYAQDALHLRMWNELARGIHVLSLQAITVDEFAGSEMHISKYVVD